ncbi:MAG: hypothetical protein IT317_02830 [Anaerolineales bacterium]|nr:hypothetical protein [Anaerolineales bacterium]
MKRILREYGLPAALLLGGALPLGFLVAFAISAALPMHRLANAAQAVAGFAVMAVCGGLWGQSVARAAGSRATTRLFWGAVAGFIVGALGAVLGLGVLEQIFVERRALGPVPIHVIFAVIFPPAMGLVSALMAFVAGGLLRGLRFGGRVAWQAGLAAAVAFLAATVIQDLLGRRVGGPNAAATFTMVSVTMIGNFVAALAAGTVLGRALAAVPGPVETAPASPLDTSASG